MDNAAAATVTTSSASEVSVSSHLFTVRGYANTKGIGVGRSIDSPAFDAAGHRWSVAFYPDGENLDDSGHISIFIRLVGGAGDDATATVLYGFSLVDPSGAAPAAEASKAPKVSTFRGADGRGVGCFMERQAFEASPYLRDDCFTIKCVIGTVAVTASATPGSELHHGFDRLLVDGGAEDAWSDVVGGSSGEASD